MLALNQRTGCKQKAPGQGASSLGLARCVRCRLRAAVETGRSRDPHTQFESPKSPFGHPSRSKGYQFDLSILKSIDFGPKSIDLAPSNRRRRPPPPDTPNNGPTGEVSPRQRHSILLSWPLRCRPRACPALGRGTPRLRWPRFNRFGRVMDVAEAAGRPKGPNFDRITGPEWMMCPTPSRSSLRFLNPLYCITWPRKNRNRIPPQPRQQQPERARGMQSGLN